jgi:ATP-dependent DNA helicase DinG
VVEPYVAPHHAVDGDAVERFFRLALPSAMPGWEPRPQQVALAQRVAAALSEGRPIVAEAGTGTGKSLAYLVPAALWALANDGKVIVSTYTKTLQGQLLSSDLPMLAAGGIAARTAVLQGRNNYACKRRLALAVEEATAGEAPERDALVALAQWEATSLDGSRGDLPFEVDPALWERVLSDGDLTLAVRCPHYATCRWYQARRAAAAAHVVVVNHALLLTDLVLKAETQRGVLPAYTRLILDEAHHLEDAATGVSSASVNAAAVRRAILPLVSQRGRQGALARVWEGPARGLPASVRATLETQLLAANADVEGLAAALPAALQAIGAAAIPDGQPLRITPAEADSERYRLEIEPPVRHLSEELGRAVDALREIEATFAEVVVPEAQAQPLLDVQRAARRLATHAATAAGFLEEAPGRVRWIEPARDRRGEPGASLCHAPVEVADVLRTVLWQRVPGVACTSATLTVADRFDHWIIRHGAGAPETGSWPSPFDHRRQAVLGLPRDLPTPDEPGFLDASARVIAEAVERSNGGAFVLCTSFDAVRTYTAALRRAQPRRTILGQGEAGREVLLARFRENPRAVLVGTDSFWEGVSVKGDGLRLVILPRLPFRVPTEPLRLARYEAIQARGADPFRAYALPEAVLKLRQGYGRLIRSHTDRGVVLLLDRRVHDRWYGQIVLRSLPDARRVVGPWRMVSEEMGRFFGAAAPPPSDRDRP